MFALKRSPMIRFGIMGIALVAVAVTGLATENDETPQEQRVEAAPLVEALVTAPVQVAEVAKPDLAEISDIQLTSSTGGGNDILEQPSEMVAVADCDITLIAASGAAAIIDVILRAPCSSNDRATVHHEGMMFSILTDADGRAQFQVPALKPSASILVSMANGYSKSVDVSAPTVAFFDRVVLQWQGDTGLQFHAFEYGATYEQAGHVWSGTPKDVNIAAAGEGGFLMVLGDASVPNPLLAEVYTFPTGITGRTGQIEMTIEAEITQVNCQSDVDAQIIQFKADAPLDISDLKLNIPDCSGVGGFLVLNNLLETMKLAQN